MIELVLIVCLKSEPETCDEKSFGHLPRVTPHACMVQSQPQIAEWSGSNPHLEVDRWFCRYVDEQPLEARAASFGVSLA